MKAEIDAEGFLHVYAESELEKYALGKWSDHEVRHNDCKIVGHFPSQVKRESYVEEADFARLINEERNQRP